MITQHVGRRLTLLSLTASLFFFAATVANAQSRSPAPAPAADALALDEVVVTARRQEEKLLDVPLAITVLTADAIAKQGISNLDDIAAATPGLTFSDVQAGFLPTPVIRGFAPIDVRGENNAAIFVDGVFVSGREGLNFSELDLERVEVVKGPQAALYGRNSFAGAINFVTAKPTNTFKGKAEAQFGSHNKVLAALSLSGPLVGDVLKGRIAMNYDSFDGSYQNQFRGIGAGASKIGGWRYETLQGSLLWTPTDNFSGEVGAYISTDILGNSAISPVQANCENTNSLLSIQTPVPAVAYLNYCGTLPAVGRNGLSAIPQATGNDRHLARGHVSLTWETGIGTLTSLTGYSKLNQAFNVDGSRNTGETVPFAYIARPATGLVPVAGGAFQAGILSGLRTGLLQIGGGSNTEEISTELRLASKKDQAFRWSTGFTYYETKADGGNDGVVATKSLPADFYAFCLSCRSAALFGGPANLTVDPTFAPPDSTGFLPWFTSPTGDAIFTTTNKTKVSAPSGFLSLDYDFAQGFTARVEGRYTREKKEFNNILTSRSGDKSWGLKNYRATLDYKPNPDMTFYGSYGHAEKSGSVSAATVRFTTAPLINVGILTAFDPEKNNEFELGFKSQLLNRRVYFDVDVYQSKWKDIVIPQIQTDLVNPATGTRTTIVTPTAFNVNAGNGTIRGAELSLTARITPHLDGSIGLSYIDAKYDNARVDTFKNFPSFTPFGDVSGKQIIRESPVQASASLRYSAPLATAGRSWYVGGDLSFRDKQFADATNEAITPSQTKLNMQLGLNGDPWAVELWGRNLTNEDGPSAAYRDVYFSNALPNGTFYRTPGGTTPAGTGGKSTFFPWRYSVSYPVLREYGITARYRF